MLPPDGGHHEIATVTAPHRRLHPGRMRQRRRGAGLGVLDQLDGPDLAERARALIDPAPPDVDSPVLKEAIRRADELDIEGRGAARLRSKRRRRSSLPTPQRNPGADMSSSAEATADAPGEETESE